MWNGLIYISCHDTWRKKHIYSIDPATGETTLVMERDAAKNIVESEGARQADSMLSQAQLLLDLSAIAPMLGLLGTTLGMLKAFGAVAQDVMVAAKPVILAQGVSQAIITTIFGLIVAIPCMAAYAYFRRRASKLVGQLELASAEIVTAVAARRGA